MAQRRTLIERLIPYVTPKVVTDFAPAPHALAENVWALDRRLRMTGGPILPSRTTIVRLPSRALLVVSPPPSAAGGLDALDALGPVAHVAVPSSFHHLYARALLARYPRARFWAAPEVFRRVPELPAGTALGESPLDAWEGAVEHAILAPNPEVSEVVLFHRASATLILTDLAFNMVRFARRLDQIAWRLNGVPAAFGPSRTGRMLLLKNRPQAAAFLRRVLEWPFERVVVAHGDAVEMGAREVMRRAFADYLPNRT